MPFDVGIYFLHVDWLPEFLLGPADLLQVYQGLGEPGSLISWFGSHMLWCTDVCCFFNYFVKFVDKDVSMER